MKDYLEHFDVVWKGTDPLLPPRRSKPPRWWTMGGNTPVVDQDPREVAKLKEQMRERRAYNKKPHGTVQHRPADCTSEPDASGTGTPGHGLEPVSSDPLPSPTTVTDTENLT